MRTSSNRGFGSGAYRGQDVASYPCAAKAKTPWQQVPVGVNASKGGNAPAETEQGVVRDAGQEQNPGLLISKVLSAGVAFCQEFITLMLSIYFDEKETCLSNQKQAKPFA